MKSRNAGSERNFPLYSFDKKKNKNVQAKSGKTMVRESSLVDKSAELMAEITTNDELALK